MPDDQAPGSHRICGDRYRSSLLPPCAILLGRDRIPGPDIWLRGCPKSQGQATLFCSRRPLGGALCTAGCAAAERRDRRPLWRSHSRGKSSDQLDGSASGQIPPACHETARDHRANPISQAGAGWHRSASRHCWGSPVRRRRCERSGRFRRTDRVGRACDPPTIENRCHRAAVPRRRVHW